MHHSEPSPEWGRSYGFDGLPAMPADDVVAADATRADRESTPRDQHHHCGPYWEKVRALRTTLDAASAELEHLAVTELPAAAEALHQLEVAVQGVHMTAVAAVRRHGAVPPGSATATDWLATSHQFTGGRASAIARAARWLEGHSATAAAFSQGRFSREHLLALIATVGASAARGEAYPEFEERLITVAEHTDLHQLRRVLRGWADVVDSASGDDQAANDYRDRRGVHLSPVGDGWDLRGWLPGVEGAELAGILNEYRNRARRATSDNDAADDATEDAGAADTPADPDGSTPATAASLTADALMDMARSAAGHLNDAARSRAAVSVLIPAHHMPHGSAGHAEANSPDFTAESGGTPAARSEGATSADGQRSGPSVADLLTHARLLACSWSCTNGPGSGYLAKSEAAWLSCDSQVSRAIINAESLPLDIGRATRVVPPWIRHALRLRDSGCVVPGCRRPAGWCEAHHVRHWSEGGATSLQNLVLMCSRHHHELHLGMWAVDMTTGSPQVTYLQRPRRARTKGPPRDSASYR